MMKIRVIQPPYPVHPEDTPSSVSFMLRQLECCDSSLDLILLPECCNAPSGCGDSNLLRDLVQKNTQQLLDAARQTAIRCQALVGINLYVQGPCQDVAVRNATLLFDRHGQIAARYDKQHLPASEFNNDAIDHSYLTQTVNPFCAEVEGVRYAFLTCYDMYYSEFIHRISIEKPDVVLICSLQRAERGDILEMQGKNCAFVCNSYVVRSSYHMGAQATTGGCSMVVAPDGKVLHNFHQEKGSFDCLVEDIRWKYSRSNGFGQPNVSNDVYQTYYRTPWCYRAGGSGVLPTNAQMAFPRLCAHRGLSPAAPENTLPAIGIAIALGAPEVEIDIRATRDGVPVVSHDASVLRLTGEAGSIEGMDYAEVRRLNPGKRFASCYDGVGYAALEDVFAAFPRRTIFNLHIQSRQQGLAYQALIGRIMDLAVHYDCAEHLYFSSEDPAALVAAAEVAPMVERCLICQKNGPYRDTLVQRAKELGCQRIQTVAEYLTPEQIQRAKQAGIRCNLYSADDPLQAKSWLDKGIDCILTDNYQTVRAGLEKM